MRVVATGEAEQDIDGALSQDSRPNGSLSLVRSPVVCSFAAGNLDVTWPH